MAHAKIVHASVEVPPPRVTLRPLRNGPGLVPRGEPIEEIAEVLGHRDLRSTLGSLSFVVHPLRDVAIKWLERQRTLQRSVSAALALRARREISRRIQARQHATINLLLSHLAF